MYSIQVAFYSSFYTTLINTGNNKILQHFVDHECAMPAPSPTFQQRKTTNVQECYSTYIIADLQIHLLLVFTGIS